MIHFSNCKINIGLHITGKREDGFHNLETIFFPVRRLCDAIELLPADEVRFSGSGIGFDCSPQDNLCVKAYRLMQQLYGIPGASIHIHKTIPMGAGLGGGSANALFVIKAADELYGLGLPKETIKEIAARLGSDAPFFAENKPAFGSGKGEVLTPFAVDLSGYWLTIVKPEVTVSTKEAYLLLKLPFQHPFPLQNMLSMPPKQWKGRVTNDFEGPVFERYPLLGEIKKMLYASGADFALMSGSGSALFALSTTPIKEKLRQSLITESMFIHDEML